MGYGMITAAVAAGTLLVTVVFGWLTSRRAQYERVVEVISYASGGAVAKARHRIGNVRYSNSEFDYHKAVEDLFVLLWAFTRIDAVRRTVPALARGPARLLQESLQPWAADWLANDFEAVCRRINEKKPVGTDDLDVTWSKSGLTALAEWN